MCNISNMAGGIIGGPLLVGAALAIGIGFAQSSHANLVDVEVTLQDGLDGYTGTEDTWLRGDGSTTNYGNQESFQPRHVVSGSFYWTSLIRFDLSDIDDAVSVNSATLSLRQYAHRNDGEAQLNVHRVLRSWIEGSGGGGDSRTGSTWMHYGLGDTDENRWIDRPDGAEGARGSGDRLDTPTDSIQMTHSSGMSYDWVEIDVTADVEAFLIDGVDNWGWFLEATQFHNEQWSFRSSEYSDDPSHRPLLTIDYAVPEPTSGLVLAGSTLMLLFRRTRSG